MANINLKPIKLASRNNNYKVENHKNNINLKDATYDEINDYFFLDEDDLVENALDDLSTFLYRSFNINDETLNKSVVKTKENNLIVKNDYGNFVYTRDNVLENYYSLTYRNENDTKYSPEVLDKLSSMGVSLNDIANDEWITKWINYYFLNFSTKINDIVILENGNIEVITNDGKYEYDGETLVSFSSLDGKKYKKMVLDKLKKMDVSAKSGIRFDANGNVFLENEKYVYSFDSESILDGDDSFSLNYLVNKQLGISFHGNKILKARDYYEANSSKFPQNVKQVDANDNIVSVLLSNGLYYSYEMGQNSKDVSLLAFKIIDNSIVYDSRVNSEQIKVNGEYYPVSWYNNMVNNKVSVDDIKNVQKVDDKFLYVKSKDGLEYYYNIETGVTNVKN